MELVTIGCRFPNGYTLEVGLQTTVKGGPKDGLISLVRRTDDYQRIKLKGTHWHNAAMFRRGILVPSVGNPEPFLNQIPKDFWERWKREHPKAAVLKSGDLFEIADATKGGNAKAAVIDAMSKPAPLAPLDPSKILTVGKDKVETANFSEDK